MKKINNKSVIAMLTACLAFVVILAVVLTATLPHVKSGKDIVVSGDGVAETATITNAGKSTDALEDGDVPSGYAATGTVVTASNFMNSFATEAQSGTYVLNSDITLLYTPPKGTQSGTPRLKSGVTFDGNGHTITLTYASASRTGIGYERDGFNRGNMSYLFDYIAGTVKNLNVKFNGQTIDNQFNNNDHHCGVSIGVMCARLDSTGRIENTKVTLNAKMTFYNGVWGSTFKTGWTDLYFGAFAGFGEGTLQNCTTVVDNTTYVNVYAGAESKATTKSRFGGLVGYAASTLKMINCSLKNSRTSTGTYIRSDGSERSSGFAIGSAEGGGSVDGFIYYAGYDNIQTGIENCLSIGFVTGISKPSTMRNIYANRQVNTYWLVGNVANQGCINVLPTADTDKVNMYFDKNNTANIVFKLKDTYTSTGILWSITHGKEGKVDLSSMKDVSGSMSRCVSISKYDGGVNLDAGTSINIVYGTGTTLNLNNTSVTYSNSDIDMRNNANVTLATNTVTKNPSAFSLTYNGGMTMPRYAGTYTMAATNQVAGTNIVYYDTTNRVAAVAGVQGTLTVNRYNLTMVSNGEYFNIAEKIYDGSAYHTSGVTGSINGVNGEKINFIIDEAFFISTQNMNPTADVSVAERLRILFHLDSPNYYINTLTGDNTASKAIPWSEPNVYITPRNIEVDGSYFSVADKTYDGTTTAEVTQTTTVNGISGQSLDLTNLSAVFNSQNVADANTVSITFRNSNANYKINNILANNNVTVTTAKKISPKKISVTFGDNLVQSYRGKSAIDTVNCVITDGLISGDSPNVIGAVVDGVDFTKFGKYTLTAHVDTENYYSDDTTELTMIYFKPSAESGKWLIESIDDFNMINDNVYYLALNYVQTDDIDAYYSVVDSVKGDFSGSYDGSNFAIKNVIMIADGAVYGLFENVVGSVSNLMVANASINSYADGAVIGGIAGNVEASGTLNNTAFVGDIYAYGSDNTVGGIVGTNRGAITGGGTVIGEILVVGDNNIAGGAVGKHSGTTTGVVNSFMIVEGRGAGNTVAPISSTGAISPAMSIFGSAINNGAKSGTGSNASVILTLKYNNQTIASIINKYRNRMNIDLSSPATAIEISNVNDLSLLREYRYMNFKLTADIMLHIDSELPTIPTLVGTLIMNGYKVYTTDGITKTEISIA